MEAMSAGAVLSRNKVGVQRGSRTWNIASAPFFSRRCSVRGLCPRARTVLNSGSVSSTVDNIDQFAFKVSDAVLEDSLQGRTEACSGPPSVEMVLKGVDGFYAALGTLLVGIPTDRLFDGLTNPAENERIFISGKYNYRKLLEEDAAAGIRVFEVSKNGFYRVFGMFEFSWESTVIVREDAKALKLSFYQKRPGMFKHMSGFWQLVPAGKGTTRVIFYSEAAPGVAVPSFLQRAASRAAEFIFTAPLEDLRRASTGFLLEPSASDQA